MRRRSFLAGAGAALAMQQSMQVAMITHAQGAHVDAYFAALAEAPEVESVALADRALEQAARKKLGSKLGKIYGSAGDLLRSEKPTMALVTMEAAMAPPVIGAVLDAGCHVLAEKPACVKMADFDSLAALARKRNKHLLLALANRVDPMVEQARKVMHSGAIGKIYGADVHIVADQTRLTRPEYHKTWFADKDRAGGGHLIWLGIHWLDLTAYLLRSRVKAVNAMTANVGGQPIRAEDSAAAVLRFENGAMATLTSGYYVDKGYHSMIKIWGSQGWLALNKHPDPRLDWYANGKLHRYEGPLEPTGYSPFVRRVVRGFLGLEAPPLTTEDSVHALRAVFACYDAAATGTMKTL